MNQLATAWDAQPLTETARKRRARNPRASGIRYIGSKARVAAAILDRVGVPTSDDGVFVDAFAGTGVVASEAAQRGWDLRVNDHLHCAVTLTRACLLTSDEVPFAKLGGYPHAIELLNAAAPRSGGIFEEYSPASGRAGKPSRMYFTEKNAARIDGVRGMISDWVRAELVARDEEILLIADLLVATNRIANIAGTYGCFLRHWLPSACEPLQLTERRLFAHRVRVEMFNADVSAVPIGAKDTVYFDPPYTKRQYAAYYHILETITVGDRPAVGGITGLRPWQAKSSDFCYRVRALGAIRRLIEGTAAQRVFLSYSSEGHVGLVELERSLTPLGRLMIHELADVGRYRPNRAARDAGSSVAEYLLELHKTARPSASNA